MRDKLTLTFTGNGGYQEAVMLNQIQRFSKSDDGEETFIHLTDNVTVLKTTDSIRTLVARMELPES